MGWEALKNTLICQKVVGGDFRSMGIAINSSENREEEQKEYNWWAEQM
jgi:hypothetical protein